ncbi:MAG: hypothetical protein AAGB29_08160 [Planctomycetota bacterium]
MNLADRLRNPAWQGELRPMIDRLEGDLMHDYFVPRYSVLSEGRPRVIVLIGVWLLLGLAGVLPFSIMSMEVGAFVRGLSRSSIDTVGLIGLLFGASMGAIELWVAIAYTRRFLARRRVGDAAA